MANLDEIKGEIGGFLSGEWTTRDGTQVPESDDIQLGNEAVKLTGTVLYADLVGSTNLVNSYKDWFAAEVYKCFLRAACRVIRNNHGTITAFDGDRVMAVYIGDSQNTEAVGSALEINHVVTELINPMIKEKYAVPKFELQQTVGIDRSPLFIAKTGVRGANDLVWVGRAANFASKLSALRDPMQATWITSEVFENMRDSVKFAKGTADSESMWTKYDWKPRGITIYGSSWRRSP